MKNIDDQIIFNFDDNNIFIFNKKHLIEQNEYLTKNYNYVNSDFYNKLINPDKTIANIEYTDDKKPIKKEIIPIEPKSEIRSFLSNI